jgi:hypothetical protein
MILVKKSNIKMQSDEAKIKNFEFYILDFGLDDRREKHG